MSEKTTLWNGLPPIIRGQYRPVSCLKHQEHEATFLCDQNQEDSRVLIKITDSSALGERLRGEYRLLCQIHQCRSEEATLFPAPVLFLETEEGTPFFFSIRSYIPGHSIESIVETQPDHPGLSLKTSCDYLDQVLSQLSFLHHMNPPVIHRDIKPQNVIVDPDGVCHLIDLDIAREISPAKERDTLILGTRLTAPPEQFGYMPTDARSDLYSAGVLLRYCLTGEYSAQADGTLEPSVRRVLEKATSFDPAQRFQKAADFQAALRRLPVSGKTKRRGVYSACALLILLLLLFSAFLHFQPGIRPDPVIITRNHFGGDAALYEMYMAGDYSQCSIALTPEGLRFVRYAEYTADISRAQPDVQSPLSEDQLAVYLDALEQTGLWRHPFNLLLVNLEIKSLRPFEREWKTDHICLEFHHCRIPEDLTPLSAIAPRLQELALYEKTEIACNDLSWLEQATGLDVLDLTFMPGQKADLSVLSRFSRMRILRLYNIPVSAEILADISGMKHLTDLILSGCQLKDLSALTSLEALKTLDLSINPEADLSSLGSLPGRLSSFTY